MADCIIPKARFASGNADASIAISFRLGSASLRGLALDPAGFQIHCSHRSFNRGGISLISAPLKFGFNVVELLLARRSIRSSRTQSTNTVVVHFYRNVSSVTPRARMTEVAAMLKAIHAQESKEDVREKAQAVVRRLQELKLKEAAKKVETGIEGTLVYMVFPYVHWQKIRTNNVMERLNREIRCRTRVVGAFPDGNSALMLVCARLRHVASTAWGTKRYMSMEYLDDARVSGLNPVAG